MGALLQDVKYGLRMLTKNPGFTAIAILTLALGIGANTAIFSIVNAVLLKPLPFPHPERLVMLFQTESAEGEYPLTGADYLDWQSQNSTFESMSFIVGPNSLNVSGAGQPEAANVAQVQANFFTTLGFSPQIGRAFAPGEDSEGHNHVAVLSDAFWKNHFGGRSDAIGKSLLLNGESYTVIGVMPAWYRFPASSAVWIPMDMSPKGVGQRGTHYAQAIGRIKAGVTLGRARADLKAIAAQIEKQYPDSNKNVSAIVEPMKELMTRGANVRIWTMLGAVGFVLLIACANVANLLLARAAGRRREMALRGALGAGRLRLVRQLLTESVMLALIGGALGAFLAYDGVALLAASKTVPVNSATPVSVDSSVLLFTFGVSLLVGLLFGLAPVLQISGINFGEELKSTGKTGSAGTGKGRMIRDVLVAAEIALSLALLAGTGLLLRTFSNLRAVDLGLRADHVLTTHTLLPEKQYDTLDKTWHFYSTLADKLANSPGITSAAVSSNVPLQGNSNGYIVVPGVQEEQESGPLVEWFYVSPAYFRTMGIRLLEGREFTAADMESVLAINQRLDDIYKSDPKKYEEEAKKAEIPAIIDQTMARRYWPKGDPLGKVFLHNNVANRIVGVVGDVKNQSLRTGPLLEAYFPVTLALDGFGYAFNVVVRTAGPPEFAANTIRSQVRSLDDRLAVFDVKTIPDIVADNMPDTTYEAALLGGLAALALLLAAVGTYGVMSYAVSQRTNEIGIRMALGAQSSNVLRMVLGQGMILTGIGIAAGLALTAAGARLIRELLYGVPPHDALTYSIAAVVLAAVALLACYLPARRAMRVDPMVALRYE